MIHVAANARNATTTPVGKTRLRMLACLSDPIVAWSPVPGASSYDVQVAPFAQGFGCEWSSTGTSTQIGTFTQNTASTAEAQAAAGQGSVTDAMIDATQASLDTQVTVALVDKGVSAFTDIMNMTF